ncbi:MAG: MBL fold metallo-hydrolase [Gemmatimonadota bacterium]
MLQTLVHDDVTELRFTTWRSRSMGFQVSAFAVRGVLIDSGFPACASDLARYVAAAPLEGCVLTHYHEDHAGGAAAVARAGVPIWMDARTAGRVRAPQPIGLYRRYTWGSPSPIGPSAPFALPVTLECVPTPGHSDDHHVVWDRGTGTVFGGDLFIGVKVRVSHRNEQPRELLQSLRRVAALNPERYFDGHKGQLADPVQSLNVKADWLENAIESIDALIAEGLDDAVIARRVLGSDWWSRSFTAGDYTMANFVKCVRSTTPT